MTNLRAWFVPLGLPIITGNSGEETLAVHRRHVMLGLMQQQPLLVSWLLSHAARHHGSPPRSALSLRAVGLGVDGNQ